MFRGLLHLLYLYPETETDERYLLRILAYMVVDTEKSHNGPICGLETQGTSY